MDDDDIITRFIWTIKNFDMCPHSPNQFLYSPTFNVGSYKFRVVLYPRGCQDPEYISVFLERLDFCGGAEVFVEWSISIVDDGIVPRYYFRSLRDFGIFSSWGVNTFLARHELFVSERCALLPNNILSIKCDVFSLTVNEINISELCDDQEAEFLSRDFAESLLHGKYSDMVISIDDCKFSVHKAILECRCQTLMSKLEKTEVPDEYLLHDIKAPVFRSLLRYFYTGIFSGENMEEDILVASDVYDVPHLKQSLTFPHYKTIGAITEIPVCQLSFRWIISDFDSKLNQELVYPAYFITAKEWGKMNIRLTIIKSDNGSTGIQLELRKLNPSRVEFIRCKISICRQFCRYSFGTCKCRKVLDSDATFKEYEHLFKEEEFETPLGSQFELCHILFDDTLNMCFDIFISRNAAKSDIERVMVQAKTDNEDVTVIKNLKLLQKDLRNMYHYKEYSDIKLRAGGAVYPVHKVVLCARSPVFAKMFENDASEMEDVVVVEGIDPGTVSSMLRYIYTGYIDTMDVSEAINLYAAADKYELLTLREKCATFLKTYMDADHIGEILLLTDLHGDESLKRCVYGYMTSNPKKVLDSKNGLSALKSRLDVYPDILNAVLENISLKD